MAFEFEALVGHVHVVSGRAIRTPPPGALCEVAPQKAARGREMDTIFVLVVPSGEVVAQATFYERLAQHAAERYFASSGSVTAGLREVFTSLNQDLYEHNHNRKNPTYEANIAIGVLRGKDLILGRVGSAVVISQHRGQVTSFPQDLNNDDQLYTSPLGIYPAPNVRMTQMQVETGTRLIFGDDNLADLVFDQMANAMLSLDLGAVLVGFKEMARLKMNVMAVEFVPLETVDAPHIPTGQSSKEVEKQARAATRVATGTHEAVGRQNPRRREQARQELARRTRQGMGRFAIGIGSILSLINRVFNRFFGPDAKGKRSWLATPMGVSSVILLPALVVVMVILMWLSGTGQTEFEICVTEANDSVALADSVATADRATNIRAWEQALLKIEGCEALREGDPQIGLLRRRAQTTLDQIYDITRLDLVVIESLERASLTDIVVQGQAMYVLDSNNGLVYRIDLEPDGLTRRSTTPIRDMRVGGVAGGSIPIRQPIIGIDYNSARNVFVAVTRDGVLIECQPNFAQTCTGANLLGVEDWVNPIAIKSWSGRLYILDPEAGDGQVWRYDPSGVAADQYLNRPVEYFGGNVARPNLSTAIDFDIDPDGVLYILLAEGIINRFTGGNPQNFQLSGFITGQEIDSATSFYIDPRAIAQDLYLVQQDRHTIYEMSYVGNYRNQYRTFNERNFDLMQRVFSAPSGNGQREIIYILSGNTIFAMDKGQ